MRRASVTGLHPVARMLPTEPSRSISSAYSASGWLAEQRRRTCDAVTARTRWCSGPRSIPWHPGRLIPGFDGALFSSEWRDAPWAKFFAAAHIWLVDDLLAVGTVKQVLAEFMRASVPLSSERTWPSADQVHPHADRCAHSSISDPSWPHPEVMSAFRLLAEHA